MEWTPVGSGGVVLHTEVTDYLFFVTGLGAKYAFHLVTVGPGKGCFFEFWEEIHRFEMWGIEEQVLRFHEGLTNMMLDEHIDICNPVRLYELVGGWLRDEQPELEPDSSWTIH